MDLVETPAYLPEHRHPWETARAAFFIRILRDAGLPRPGAATLDVGSGDGWFAGCLADAMGLPAVTCWDSAYAGSPAGTARHPALHFVTTPPDGRYDLALLLDVLEHVDDDAGFLKAIVDDRLSLGASVLVSVPAWQPLFSDHDRLLQHRRRYSPSRALALMEGTGLQVLRTGGLFHSLLLPRALQLGRERVSKSASRSPHAGEWRGGPLVTRLLHAALVADSSISRLASRVGIQLPGLTWWALCRK